MIGQNLRDTWMGAESPPYKTKVEHGRSYVRRVLEREDTGVGVCKDEEEFAGKDCSNHRPACVVTWQTSVKDAGNSHGGERDWD